MSLLIEENIEQSNTSLKVKKIEGNLKFFNFQKGYGFVETNSGEGDVLLSLDVVNKYGDLNLFPGDSVACEIIESSKGMFATKIIDILKNVERQSEEIIDNNSPCLSEKKFRDIRPEDLQLAIVRWYDERKGYGFAVCHEDVGDIMLSRAILRECGIRKIFPGDRINIIIEENDRGHLATYIEYC